MNDANEKNKALMRVQAVVKNAKSFGNKATKEYFERPSKKVASQMQPAAAASSGYQVRKNAVNNDGEKMSMPNISSWMSHGWGILLSQFRGTALNSFTC